jgi:alcohol dehydrogenase
MSWEFASPVHLVFGAGSLSQLSQLVPWRSILVVTTPGAAKRGTIGKIRELLRDREVTVYDAVAPQPQLNALEEAARKIKVRAYEGIVAIGGGSVIDTAKAFSYLLNADSQGLRPHLERGVPLPPIALLPVLAVPTTAGTGAEVTPFATVWDATAQKKYSLASPELYPQIALLDPELTLSASMDLTLSTGLDALCQGLESLWSRSANPVAMSLARRAVSISLQFLPSAVDDLDNLDLRTRMMEASLLAGLAIASTKTTLSHSISYPLTLHFGVPHGLACAFTIAQVLRFNAESEEGRLQEIVLALGFDTADGLAQRLEDILEQTGALKWLATLIPPKSDLLAIAPQAMAPGRADNNPRAATLKNIEAILADALTNVLRGAGPTATDRVIR